MSETQALAIADETALMAANPGLTLLQGYQVMSTQADAYRMDDDEREDLDGVKIRPLRLKMDGTTGKFSTTEEGAEEWDSLDKTVILAPLDDSQVLFPKKDQQQKQIWPEGATDWPKFICRADSIHGVPKLHPEMTEAHIALAVALKVNGALNVVRAEEDKHLPNAERRAPLNCTTCPHAQFTGPANARLKPNCSTHRNLLVFEEHTKEPALLQVKGTGIQQVEKHLAAYKRQDKALFTDLITVGSKQVIEDGIKWKVMTFTKGPEIGLQALPAFRQMRKMMRPLLLEEMRSGRNVVLGSDDELTHDEPAAPAPVGDSLDPIDPRDPLPDGTPSEFDLF